MQSLERGIAGSPSPPTMRETGNGLHECPWNVGTETDTTNEGNGMEAKDIGNRADVDEAIRETWYDVCRDFPNATTPLVAKRVAEEYGVSVSRVLEAFPASRDYAGRTMDEDGDVRDTTGEAFGR